MISKLIFITNKIKLSLKKNYGINIHKLIFIPEGETSFCYKGKTILGKSYFIKIISNKRIRDVENTLQILLEISKIEGVDVIIPTIKSKKGNFVEKIDDKYFFVVSKFIENKGFVESFHDNQINFIAQNIAKIHNYINQIPQDKIPREDFNINVINESKKLIRLIAENDYEDKNFQFLKNLIIKNETLILNKLKYLENLQKKISKNKYEWVLAHEDLHQGNFLISKKEKLYIVDWDRMKISPREQDFIFFIKNINYFKSCYEKVSGKINLDSNLMRFFILRRIFEDFNDWGFQIMRLLKGKIYSKKELKQLVKAIEKGSIYDMVRFNDLDF